MSTSFVADSPQVLVQGSQPAYSSAIDIDPALLQLFRAYRSDEEAVPYKHQAEAFAHVLNNCEVALTAGTAAGKTLAIGVPLVQKLFIERSIRKVVLLYPTRALLDDQSRVMRELVRQGAAIGSEGTLPSDPTQSIGRVRGGLTSSQLIEQLGKPLVLATPDAVYWLFRKNVKFSMALIYGLAQADEIVVDEAHLFNGLMLHNTVHLLDRLHAIRQEYFKRPLRVHYLTATGNTSLQRLSPVAKRVDGVSSSGPVEVVLRACTRDQTDDAFIGGLHEALDRGCERVLVVCNSAKRAHILFNRLASRPRGDAWRANVPQAFWEQFGLVKLGQAISTLEGIVPESGKYLRRRARDELKIRARDLSSGDVFLRSEYLVALGAQQIERDIGVLQRALQHPEARNGDRLNGVGVMKLLRRWNRRKTPTFELPAIYGFHIEDGMTLIAAQSLLDDCGTEVSRWLEDAIAIADEGHGVHVTNLSAETFRHVLSLRPAKGIADSLKERVASTIARRCVLDKDSVELSDMPFSAYVDRLVSVRLVLTWFSSCPDGADDSTIQLAAKALLDSAPNHTAVGLFKSRRAELSNEQCPLVLLYSGSMARYSRDGIIDLFGKVTGRPVILFSTSAVEVGVDFEADALVTEECEGSSFLQRFGRIGRRPGLKSVAIVLIEPGKLAHLTHALAQQEWKDSRVELSRDLFANTIQAMFPERSFVESSLYADSLQLIVARQIGRTGIHLTEQAPTEVLRLAEQIARADVDVAYGLRGTLPAVSLADEGVSKDPFYILGYVGNDSILPPSSPFEVAHLDRSFNSLLFEPAQRLVFCQLAGAQGALKQCSALALMSPDGPLIVSAEYVERTGDVSPIDWFNKCANKAAQAIDYCSSLPEEQRADAQAFYWRHARIDLPFSVFSHPNLLLAYGPIPLGGMEREGQSMEAILDKDGGSLALPPQWYLVLRGVDAATWRRPLEAVGGADLDSEIHYDDVLLYRGLSDAIVLVERQAGAVWDVWERLWHERTRDGGQI